MSDTRWVWIELGCTVVVPTVVLMFGTGWLGTTWSLLVALAFPMGFAVASMVRDGRPSGLAVISLGSVILTGAVGLLELDPRWFALKEAAVSGAFGLAMAGSAATRFAVVPLLLERVLDPIRTREALERSGGGPSFDRLARRGTIEMGLVLVCAAPVNFLLARLLVQAPAGSEAFAHELGSYTFWSFPLVTVPVVLGTGWVLVRLRRSLEAATGVALEDLMVA